MAKFVVLNSVCSDGLGDFSHFEDIMKNLLANPKFKDVEFTAIVDFESREPNSEEGSVEELVYYASLNDSTYLMLHERLKALKIKYFYGRDGVFSESNTTQTIQQVINEADQGISISFASGNCIPYRQDLIKRGIPVKHIGEHEISPTFQHVIQRGLGLSKGHYGVKIQDITPIGSSEAWSIILKNDPEFAEQLLKKTNSENFASFNTHNIVVPAYFNNANSAIMFLKFLSFQKLFTQGKNIIVYHSGKAFISNKNIDLTKLENTSIGNFELCRPQNDSIITDINSPTEHSVNIKVFSGFNVSNLSFDAIFQLSKIAGISGDNTLERCISMNILPFYRSTNYRSKESTLRELKKISQLNCLIMPLEVRKSYNIFFDPDVMNSFFEPMSIQANKVLLAEVAQYQHVDLQKMIQYWPVITEYLRLKKNFYNNLEGIIVEKLPNRVLKQLTIPNQSPSSQTGWNTRLFSLFKKKHEKTTTVTLQQKITEEKNPGK